MLISRTFVALIVVGFFTSCVHQKHQCMHQHHSPHAMSHSSSDQDSDSMIQAVSAHLSELNDRFAEEQYTALLSNYFEAETDPEGNTVSIDPS